MYKVPQQTLIRNLTYKTNIGDIDALMRRIKSKLRKAYKSRTISFL